MTTQTAIIHEPWCDDHVVEDDGSPIEGACARTFLLETYGNQYASHRLGVEIGPRPVDEGGYGIDCWVAERRITPDEARQMAAALLRAADVLDGSGGRPDARIVRVADLSRDGVWLEDYGILLVDSAVTPDEDMGLLADVTTP